MSSINHSLLYYLYCNVYYCFKSCILLLYLEDCFKNQLKKCSIQEKEKMVLTSLRKLPICKDLGDFSVWMSEHLPVDLDLDIDLGSVDCKDILQLFFLGIDQPIFLLTLYENKRHFVPTTTKTTQAGAIDRTFEHSHQKNTLAISSSRSIDERSSYTCHEYTVSVVQALWASLLTYCYCDFVILPCTLSFQEFNKQPDILMKELGKQSKNAHQYYGGPLKLNRMSYDSLKEAATGLLAVTRMPHMLYSIHQGTNVSVSMSWGLKSSLNSN